MLIDCHVHLNNYHEVFADISGLTLGDFTYAFERYMMQRVKDMISYMGDPGRQLMYGSDWPLVNMEPYVRFLDGLDLRPDQIENVAWKTAARLFDIDLSYCGGPAEIPKLPPRA